MKKEGGDEMRILHDISRLHEDLEDAQSDSEKQMISSQIRSLKELLDVKRKQAREFKGVEKAFVKPLPKAVEVKILEKGKVVVNEKKFEDIRVKHKVNKKEFNLSDFEKRTLNRLTQKSEKEKEVKKKKGASAFVKFSAKYFSDYADKIIKQGNFKSVEKDLPRTHMQFLPKTYVSVILGATFLSAIAGLFIFVFFLFFNLGVEIPFITLVEENILLRFVKVFWIMILVPVVTFAFMYTYPSLERKSAESRIDTELPFATIHMSAISGSMVEPSKIFEIIVSTREYPHLEKEFIKLLNEINVLGYDLVTALRHSSINSPSRKLGELFNGLATTINSGGSLPNFFDKRSESLLFDYRLEREKKTRASETFMDIYISVVIAAPMVLMLLLMMMKISGLGIALSANMITLIMGLGVTGINIAFLTFLHLKGAGE